MNGRNRQQGRNYGHGQRNEYDRGYDQQNYGRRFEGDRVFEGQQRSTASEYPEYMDQHNSYNRQPSTSRTDHSDYGAERYGNEYTGQSSNREHESNYGRATQGGRSMEQWSPSNGTDYRADHDRSNRGYDQYSQNTEQRSYDQSSNRGYNQGFGQSYGMGYGQSYGSNQRADYGQRDWERSSQGRFSGVAPKGYRRSDERIQEDLNDALTQDQHIDASEIDVTVENGVVTLKGTVSERRMKRLAEDCAEHIRGVSDVRNELRVQAESSTSNTRTWSDSMSTSTTDGKSSDKNDNDTASARGGKSSSRSSTEGRNYQS